MASGPLSAALPLVAVLGCVPGGGAGPVREATPLAQAAAAPAWKVDSSAASHRFTTGGRALAEHRFGFVKPTAVCDLDILWLSWTSAQPVDDLKGVEAVFRLAVGETTLDIPLDVIATSPPELRPRRMALTNFVAEDKLVALLGAGGEATLTLLGPADLLERVAIPSDRFDLDGYTAGRAAARHACRTWPAPD